MGKVLLDMSMSVDGFIAAPDGDDAGLNDWYFAESGRNAEIINDLIQTCGALVIGRRSYDMGDQHDGYVDNPYEVPHFVVTHQPPQLPAKGDTQFVFVTNGIEIAIQQAQHAAGDKLVVVGGGAGIAQQLLNAGLIDEIQLHVVPVLLGNGMRLFDHLAADAIQLEQISSIEGPGVTHVKYAVSK